MSITRLTGLAGRPARERGLEEWAACLALQPVPRPRGGGLRFALYGRVSTEDHQDPVTSLARQREQARMLVARHGRIVAEYFDAAESRVLPWARRPQAAALLAAMADPDRGFDAIVVGEYERAFYGSQYSLMAPLFEHYDLQLWTPESGGRIDFQAEDHEQMMLGWQSKREIIRTKIRVRTAMAAQTREQGRYLGGRPPYGYRLADAGPHPNKAHAAWGRRAHRLEPDPVSAPVVKWMFVHKLAGHSVARIARAQRCRDPLPVGIRPQTQPTSQRQDLDAGHRGSDSGEPPLHRAAGVEPAAHRLRSDRPRQYRVGPPAGAAVKPARGLGHLGQARPPGAGQRGRLHRRPGGERPTRSRRHGGAAVSASRAAGPAAGGWNPPGRTAGPPTGVGTVIPAPPALAPSGRRSSMSVRTRSCPAWLPWPSCWPVRNMPNATQTRLGGSRLLPRPRS
jgi:DNA invertase Pin-like site-specific DNA recombinase